GRAMRQGNAACGEGNPPGGGGTRQRPTGATAVGYLRPPFAGPSGPHPAPVSTALKPIQMVDLVGQYHRIKEEVDRAVLGVMGSAQFINGPEVKAFEQELAAYLGARHAIACANGTDALQIAMMSLGLEPGDEVITP